MRCIVAEAARTRPGSGTFALSREGVAQDPNEAQGEATIEEEGKDGKTKGLCAVGGGQIVQLRYCDPAHVNWSCRGVKAKRGLRLLPCRIILIAPAPPPDTTIFKLNNSSPCLLIFGAVTVEETQILAAVSANSPELNMLVFV